jgi:hypothetical protein
MPTCKYCGEKFRGYNGSKVPGVGYDLGDRFVLIEGERPIHACPTVTKEDLREAVELAGAATFKPPPGVGPFDTDR